MLPLWCPKAKWGRSAGISPHTPPQCHLTWMQGDIWKVISYPPHVRTLVCLVMLDGRKVRSWKVISCAPCVRTFPLYTFQMSSCVDARWHLKSHLASTSHENFGVVELTLGHTRWTWGEIRKVILNAPWWSWHLVTLDGRKVKFEKSSCMHLGGADTWSH